MNIENIKNVTYDDFLTPYSAYNFKDDCRDFDFVCLACVKKYVDIETAFIGTTIIVPVVNLELKIMFLNYLSFIDTGFNYGDINIRIIDIGKVRHINNKTKRIQNAIKLAKLMNV